MVGPEAFMEVRYLAHRRQMDALELIPQIAAEFGAATAAALGSCAALACEPARAGRQAVSAAASIALPGARMRARCKVFSSSRTLPGQPY